MTNPYRTSDPAVLEDPFGVDTCELDQIVKAIVHTTKKGNTITFSLDPNKGWSCYCLDEFMVEGKGIASGKGDSPLLAARDLLVKVRAIIAEEKSKYEAAAASANERMKRLGG